MKNSCEMSSQKLLCLTNWVTTFKFVLKNENGGVLFCLV